MELVTGYAGESHVTSRQASVMNAVGIATDGKYIIPNLGNGVSAEIIDATTIRVNDGFIINQGRLMEVAEYEDLTISSGTSGSKRMDLIVARYEKDNVTGIESVSLVVIEGQSGAEYVEPDYYNNNLINDESSVDDVVLYAVKIDGLTPSIERVANRWYMDTGWREDWIINATTTGITQVVPLAIRIIGNQVFTRGRVSVNQVGFVDFKFKLIDSTFKNNAKNCYLLLNKKGPSPDFVHSIDNAFVNFSPTLYPEGISVSSYDPESSTITRFFDFDLSWFLD